MNFGTWSITATVNITQVAVSDNLTFSFNFLKAIQNQDIQIPSSVHKGENFQIQFIVTNQLYSTSWCKLSLTIVDAANIPVTYSTLTVADKTQNVTVIDAAITIPAWAFPGNATVYLCPLANSTDGKTVPSSAESIVSFQILP